MESDFLQGLWDRINFSRADSWIKFDLKYLQAISCLPDSCDRGVLHHQLNLRKKRENMFLVSSGQRKYLFDSLNDRPCVRLSSDCHGKKTLSVVEVHIDIIITLVFVFHVGNTDGLLYHWNVLVSNVRNVLLRHVFLLGRGNTLSVAKYLCRFCPSVKGMSFDALCLDMRPSTQLRVMILTEVSATQALVKTSKTSRHFRRRRL